jgi:hypothetical protein
MSSDRPTCVDCNAKAPETKTDETLVSTIGWRLERRRASGGANAMLFLWRCPACWRAFKGREKVPDKGR